VHLLVLLKYSYYLIKLRFNIILPPTSNRNFHSSLRTELLQAFLNSPVLLGAHPPNRGSVLCTARVRNRRNELSIDVAV